MRRYLQPLRATLTAPQLPAPTPTVREVTRWITSRPDRLTDDDVAKLQKIKARSLHLNAAADHVTAFAEMMTGRHGERLTDLGVLDEEHLGATVTSGRSLVQVSARASTAYSGRPDCNREPVASTVTVTAAQREAPAVDAGVISGLGIRNIVSATMSGRISAVAARNQDCKPLAESQF